MGSPSNISERKLSFRICRISPILTGSQQQAIAAKEIASWKISPPKSGSRQTGLKDASSSQNHPFRFPIGILSFLILSIASRKDTIPHNMQECDKAAGPCPHNRVSA
jgi:hypothetical protein